MKNICKIIGFFCVFSLFSGCATTDYQGTDIYTFLPGGSTYKHFKRAQINDLKNQTDFYREDGQYDFVDYDVNENMIELRSNGEYQQVSVDVLGFWDSLSEPGAGMSLTWDFLKTALYALAGYELQDSNGGGGGSGGSSGGGSGSQSGNVIGGDATIINNSGDGNSFTIGGSGEEVVF